LATSYLVHRDGRTARSDQLDPAWLRPDSGVMVWADISQPTADDALILKNVFNFHPLAIEDAMESSHHPKIESYGSYLYVVMHGIDFKQEEHAFETLDVDFFLGRNYLVTVHDGRRRSVGEVADLCARNDLIMAEGPPAVMHRIIDRMIDHYQPEVDELEEWLDDIETQVVSANRPEMTKEILAVKRDIAAMRRVVIPQRDVVGRLGRREFDLIGQEHAYRFRDIYDQLVRLSEEAFLFQDRVTGILDAHLAAVSNQLALVSKVLTGIAVIFGPLTVITGVFGMNVELPVLPGGPAAQFWWIATTMVAITLAIYLVFKRRGWL
jgi:magnesium transporter